METLKKLFYLSSELKDLSIKDKLRVYLSEFLEYDYGDLDYEYYGNDLKERLNHLECFDEFKFSFEKFDCVTFVETILALLFVTKFNDFEQFFQDFTNTLKEIRYKDGKPTFFNRNHFMCLDWLTNNKKLLKDIPLEFENTDTTYNHKKTAEVKIDKISWLTKHKALEGIEEKDSLNKKQILENINEAFRSLLETKKVETSYIQIDWLTKNYDEFVENMPEIFISFIVRPNWDIKEKIGTCINISHLGFCIKNFSNDNNTYKIDFYHASSEELRQVVKVDFWDYLKDCLTIPSIDGVNVKTISLF